MVLASASPRRAAVLRQLGFEPTIRPAEVDESRRPGEAPEAYVERLARTKARAGARPVPAGAVPPVVIAGDTVVVDRGEILLKPRDRSEAVAMLLGLSGGRHDVLTGVAVARQGRLESAVARAEVRFRSVDRTALEAYVATGEPLDKAGGYGIQGLGAALVEGIEGDYYAVVGQPVGLLMELFDRLGLRYDFSGSLRP